MTPAYSFQLDVQKLDEQSYALVGKIGLRSQENHALNNTSGFVITNDGVVLVSPGANAEGAKLLEATIKKITDKPIIRIITIGVQDHHWMGSYYFKNKGIPIIALERTVNAQKEHVKNHQTRLAKLYAQAEEDIHYAWTENPIAKDSYKFTIGGVDFELLYPGDGHFSGDAVLWLAGKKLLFTGDFVFMERILGIHPFTDVRQWSNSFDTLMKLEPEYIIPGHGHINSAEQARKQTGNYLHWLIDNITKSIDDMEDIASASTRLHTVSPFKSLQFHENWNRKNIYRTYLQLESEDLNAVTDIPDLLIDADELAQQLDSDKPPVVLEVRYHPHRYFTIGHIPGAIQVQRFKDLGDNFASSIMRFPSYKVFQQRLRSWGINNDSNIVIYDDSSTALASRLYFSLQLYGYDMNKVRLLNGGTINWTVFNDLTKKSTAIPEKGNVTLKPANPDMLIEWSNVYNDIVSRRDDKVVLIDMRPADMYQGKVIKHAVQGGHIPGAINIVSLLGTDGQSQTWRSKDEIAALYAEIPKDKTLYLYCHDGFRMSLGFMQLKLLGYKDIRLLNGGWTIWDKAMTLPIVKGDKPYDEAYEL